MALPRLQWVILLAFAASCAGCHRSNEPGLFPARGNLVYRGQPLAGAEIVLHPDASEPGWMPVAMTDEAGAFAASSKLPGDGAPAGRYRLSVVWRPQRDADGEGPNLLPVRYADARTSALELTVGPDANDVPTFRLTD